MQRSSNFISGTVQAFKLLILAACLTSTAAAEDDAPKFEPAGLIVLVHDRMGMAIGTWRPYEGNPWLEHDSGAARQWALNRPYNPGGAAGQIGSEIHDALELKRRHKAMGPYWDSIDQDQLDERLMRLMRCHAPVGLAKQGATIKDMTFFGASKAGYLRKYTPGNVIVVQAMMGLSPELDQMRVRIEESVWTYPSRALAKRELKRLGRDKAAKYEPVVSILAVHSYYHDVQNSAPLGIGILNEPEESVVEGHMDYRAAGERWQANDSAMLKEQIERAFEYVAKSMRDKNGSTCTDQ